MFGSVFPCMGKTSCPHTPPFFHDRRDKATKRSRGKIRMACPLRWKVRAAKLKMTRATKLMNSVVRLFWVVLKGDQTENPPFSGVPQKRDPIFW